MLGRYISLVSRLPGPAALVVRGAIPWHANSAAEPFFAAEAERAHLIRIAGVVHDDGEARIHLTGERRFALAPLFDAAGEIDAVLVVESSLARLPKVLNEFQRRLMFEREQRVSAMLQRAMLPSALPAVPGLRFDIAYAAASEERSVGGDWYDAFELEDGLVAIAIGDIAGHGFDAAIVMGSIRQVMRAVSLEDSDPAAVLTRVNRSLAREHGALASVFYGVLDPMTLELAYGNAGHPPPYVVSDGDVSPLPMNGILLGSQDDAPAQTQRVSLPSGGAIVLYTDGIIERTRDIAQGEADLQAALARWSAADFVASSADLQDEILAGGPRHDDAAMFIIRVADDGSLDITLPASLRNATRMRNAFERFVRRRGFSAERAFEITLGVAEAINNAAEHAYGGRPGTIRLCVNENDRWLQATVIDAGSWSENHSDPDRGRGLGIMRRVFDDVAYARGERGTRVSLRARLPDTACEPLVMRP